MILNKIKGIIYGKENRNCGCGGERQTVSVSGSYFGRDTDFYIAVVATKASTIYLPVSVRDGKIIVVKSEMKPPMSGRYITVATVDGSLIDGYKEDTITVSHDSRTYLYNNGSWHKI